MKNKAEQMHHGIRTYIGDTITLNDVSSKRHDPIRITAHPDGWLIETLKGDEWVTTEKIRKAFNHPIEHWAYEVAKDLCNRDEEEAIKCANLVYSMYMKDNNATPVGHLCDYVAKNLEKLEAMKSKWDQLEDFYNNYETEVYGDCG